MFWDGKAAPKYSHSPLSQTEIYYEISGQEIVLMNRIGVLRGMPAFVVIWIGQAIS